MTWANITSYGNLSNNCDKNYYYTTHFLIYFFVRVKYKKSISIIKKKNQEKNFCIAKIIN
jgi:hypothetical protein